METWFYCKAEQVHDKNTTILLLPGRMAHKNVITVLFSFSLFFEPPNTEIPSHRSPAHVSACESKNMRHIGENGFLTWEWIMFFWIICSKVSSAASTGTAADRRCTWEKREHYSIIFLRIFPELVLIFELFTLIIWVASFIIYYRMFFKATLTNDEHCIMSMTLFFGKTNTHFSQVTALIIHLLFEHWSSK